MNKRISIIFTLLLCTAELSAQIYLATDKKTYVAGEQVHCSAFTVDADALCYVQLSDEGTLASSAKIALEKGRGAGSLDLPLTLPTGNYCLTAYTATGSADSFPITVFNTFSTEKLPSTKVAEGQVEASKEPVSYANGLKITANGHKVTLTNSSSFPVSGCVSVTLRDALSGSFAHGIEDYSGITGSNVSATEADGEVIKARLAGPDAEKIGGMESVTAVFSFPGLKSDVYTCQIPKGADISVPTENVFGKRDVACMLYGMPDGSVCHLEIIPKSFDGPQNVTIPSLELSNCFAGDILDRAKSLRTEVVSRDTLTLTLPVRQPHFLLEKECTRYNLDDYTRFPTMEEEFVEIIKNVRRRRGEDRTRQIQLAITPDPLSSSFKWGTTLVMIDGVPIFNHNQIWNYDPAIVRAIETYPHSYSVGYRMYDGVVNIVTYNGNLPIISFDDNVRLYDFVGCSYPVVFKGTNTLYWHPMISLLPGESLEIDCSSARYGSIYDVTSEGVTSEGHAVCARGQFGF